MVLLFWDGVRGAVWAGIVLVICATIAEAQDPVLVSKMAANEAASYKGEIHYTYYSEEISSRTGGHRWREKVVETDDGPLRRLLAVDGKPLSAMQARAEEARIQALIYDPSSFKQANQAHLGDEAHAAHLLGLLPRAFLLAAAGEENGCARFSFRPNPAFEPSDYEERLAHAMEGTVSLRQPMNRLCLLNARIATPVEFGFGFLGRIESGGRFSLERVPMDTAHWKSDYISVHIEGRVLMLKSLTRNQDVRRTDITSISQHLSLNQAAELSAR